MKRNKYEKLWTRISSVSIVLLFLTSAFAPAVTASISPETLDATLQPGESITEIKTVVIPAVPARADVLFAFDLTGSMGGIISTAKSQSGNIMTALDAIGVDINYGVVSYMDYPDYYSSFGYTGEYGTTDWGCGDYAYQLDSPITSDRSIVTSSISGLGIGCGSDGPQDYSRIMYESYADPAVSWRPGAKKILLNFGDNLPHDNNLYEGVPGYPGTYSTGGDPGRNEIMDETSDPSKIGVGNDDLNLQTVLAEMADNNVILLESHTSTSGFMLDAWTYWTGITGGALFTTSSTTLPADVVTEVTAALTSPTVDNVHLAASSGYESWISSSDSYTGPTGVTQTFSVTITVPDGTPAGDYNFQISAVDSSDVSYGDQDVTIHVPESNNPPVAEAGGPYTVDEGSEITLDGSGSYDPDGDPLTYAWDLDNDGTYETPGVFPTIKPPEGFATLTVGLQVSDGTASSTDTATINVNNVAPTIDTLSTSANLVQMGTSIKLDSIFSDPGVLDPFTADWDCGDATTNIDSLVAGSTLASHTHTYEEPGVYTVCLNIADDDGGEDTLCTTEYVVVYDSSGGFVTGGGTIDSPAGAYTADTSLTGQANFGFVSKYKRGATVPEGQTEFQFKVADLNFHSTAYDWLVIAGSRAQFKGTGTINGEGNFGFMLTAIDGQNNGGGGSDKFRIKIWDIANDADDAVIYDNQIGDLDNEDLADNTILTGGSIVIHAK